MTRTDTITLALPSKRVEDYDDCLAATEDIAIATGADVSRRSLAARWDGRLTREFVLVTVDAANADLLTAAGFQAW